MRKFRGDRLPRQGGPAARSRPERPSRPPASRPQGSRPPPHAAPAAIEPPTASRSWIEPAARPRDRLPRRGRADRQAHHASPAARRSRSSTRAPHGGTGHAAQVAPPRPRRGRPTRRARSRPGCKSREFSGARSGPFRPRPSRRRDPPIFLLAVFSATSEIRYEHPRGHPRKCVRPRPRNFRAAFPEKFPKKFSRFVFAFRFFSESEFTL